MALATQIAHFFEGIRRPRSLGDVVAIVVIVTSITYYFTQQLHYAMMRGNQLTEFFDAYSEANGIRAGEAYADHGFGWNYGLQEVSYGTMFDTIGGKYDKNLCPSSTLCVYKHYPPGPDLIIGAMTKMCGKGQVACFRYAPLFTGLFCLSFMAWAIARTVGAKRSAFVVASFYFAPMTTNAFHYLHNHSYATSFCYLQIGLLMFAFADPGFSEKVPIKRRWAAALFGVGFLQGWIAFDMAFHVALMAIAVWLLFPNPRGSWKKMAACVVMACAGYFVANMMHFWQVAAYYGSWSTAYHDFADRGAMRAGGSIEAAVQMPTPGNMLLIYWVRLLPEVQFLGFQYLNFVAFVFSALLVRGIAFPLRGGRYAWMPERSYKWAFLVAFIIPNFWLVIMRQHSTVHGHFLPRNFVLALVFGVLALAMGWKSLAPEAPATSEAEAT